MTLPRAIRLKASACSRQDTQRREQGGMCTFGGGGGGDDLGGGGGGDDFGGGGGGELCTHTHTHIVAPADVGCSRLSSLQPLPILMCRPWHLHWL